MQYSKDFLLSLRFNYSTINQDIKHWDFYEPKPSMLVTKNQMESSDSAPLVN